MSTPFSPYWYRVGTLKPKLRPHVRFDRQYQRGQLWYVLENQSMGRNYRFTPAAYELIGRMDGRRMLETLWEEAVSVLGEEAPTQDETIRILSTLHALDLIQCEIPNAARSLLMRYQNEQPKSEFQRYANPMGMSISLFDPDPFLNKIAPWLGLIFNRYFLLLWLLIVCSGVILAAQHWVGLMSNVSDHILSPQNIFLISLIYPVIKFFHELGHAAATKYWGGNVHDLGVFIMGFIPTPYVDCTSAALFRRKHQRIIVSAAGIMVELFLAALAVWLWVNVEQGFVRACAYNVIIIAGLSSLVFNGNPLIRLDAYYMLMDYLEISNLASRSKSYIGYLVLKYLFAVPDAQSPVSAQGERGWFVFYSISSFFYQQFIAITLIWFIAGKYFFIGILLAIWVVLVQIVWPLFKSLRSVVSNPAILQKWGRVLSLATTAVIGITLLLFIIPFPLTTTSEGVVWMPEKSIIRSGTEAVITKILVTDGEQVVKGQALIEMEDPFLDAEVKMNQSRVHEYRASFLAAYADRVKLAMLRDRLAEGEARLKRSQEKKAELILRSPANGSVIIPALQNLPGRYVKQGDVLAFLHTEEGFTAQVVVAQERMTLVQNQTQGISVRLAERIDDVLQAKIKRHEPESTRQLPSAALSTVGGGELPADPQDKKGQTSLNPVFKVELSLLGDAKVRNIGERLFVRFEHGYEPLALQSYRWIRQLFLGRFSV